MQLANHIIEQRQFLNLSVDDLKSIKNEIKERKMDSNKSKFEEIRNGLDSNKNKLLDCITEKGASNWLTAVPIKDKGFYLNKSEFWDAIYLRYGFELKRIPSICSCGKSFTIEHALTCPIGGYISMRHNVIRNTTAELLDEVCKDVQLEPKLQELTGERFNLKSTITEDEARLDVSARNFWSQGTKAFLDIRIFNPLAKSYQGQDLKTAHSLNEKQKKRAYNQRIIDVEHGCFTPLVFSCFGGMSRECSAFFKHLTMLIADKRDAPFHEVSSFIRTRISFSLLRVAIICIRGHRSKKNESYEKISATEISTTVEDARLK